MHLESVHLHTLSEIERLKTLICSIKPLEDSAALKILIQDERSKESCRLPIFKIFEQEKRDTLDELVFFSIAVIGQAEVVFRISHSLDLADQVKRLHKVLDQLKIVERFYKELGGILGYHLTVLELIQQKRKKISHSGDVVYESPPRFDLTEENEENFRHLLSGIEALETCGELYPIGGLGDRLNLHDEFNQPLPAACLKFEGRTLLEGLIRDIQAREYLYYKLTGKQLTIPVALMTSHEKGNHRIISSILEDNNWFGRSKDNFKLFSQPSVPVITEEGFWSMLGELELNLKPGGHGVIWKQGDDQGVFKWFLEKNKTRLLVRQINNPIAGVDNGLLDFIGVGYQYKKTFGLASCPRLVHAAEGVLVLRKKEGKGTSEFTYSNIEYTDFETHGIEDVVEEGKEKEGYSRYPANTNILYVDLEQFLPLSKEMHTKGELPGPLINMKNRDSFICSKGEKTERVSGRLETMMQNVSDWIVTKSSKNVLKDLNTYITFNHRQKTISVTKRSYEKDKPLMETPEGCFFDMMVNGINLLKRCGFTCPELFTPDEYKLNGPSCIFKYHPALGPLYSIITQKLRGGSLAPRSELQLEIAEVDIENLHVFGSLLIKSVSPLGHMNEDRHLYSECSSRCVMKNVTVKNKGLKFSPLSSYWQDTVEREESLTIELGENSEFYAENMTLEGSLYLNIPSNERWILKTSQDGILEIIKEPIQRASWRWNYVIKNQCIDLRVTYQNNVPRFF